MREPAPTQLRYPRLLTQRVTTLREPRDAETACPQCLLHCMTDTLVASHRVILSYQQSMVMQGVSTLLWDRDAHS